MARYEHLPIYKAALDLAVHMEKVVLGFSRYHKYTLGAELRLAAHKVLQGVVKANGTSGAQQRAAVLEALRLDIEALLITMRLGKEVRAFKSFAAYLHAVEQVGVVARQNEGWFKHTREQAQGLDTGVQRGA